MFLLVVLAVLLLLLAGPTIRWSDRWPRWWRAIVAGQVYLVDPRASTPRDPAPPVLGSPAPSTPPPAKASTVEPLSTPGERAEKLLARQLLAGELDVAEYQRAMARLAQLDDLVAPVVVPPSKGEDQPRE